MSGVLLHDGQRSGHLGWCVGAVAAGVADGVIISPFSTPRITAPRSPSGADLAHAVRAVHGEVLFDPTTHARLLPGANRLEHYDTWELWGPAGVGLDAADRRVQHVERVFQRQQDLGVPFLAPTPPLDSPQGRLRGTCSPQRTLPAGFSEDAGRPSQHVEVSGARVTTWTPSSATSRRCAHRPGS